MDSPAITETEIIEFLVGIEAGAVLLTPLDDPQDVYAGNVRYRASNGWRIVIFNDANEWDYVDSIEATDGRSINFHQLDEMMSIRNYQASNKVAWEAYGIPGYMQFRCTVCSKKLTNGPPFLKPYICPTCQGTSIPKE